MKNENLNILFAMHFKELSLKCSIEKITIKQITDGVGVIRPTFYNHFQDKYRLLEWIIETELLLPAEPLFRNGMYREAFYLILVNIKKDNKFYIQAARVEGQNCLGNMIQSSIEKKLKNWMESNDCEAAQSKWDLADMMAELYAQSVSYVIVKWIKAGMKIQEKEVVEKLFCIINPSELEKVNSLAAEKGDMSLKVC